MPGDAGILYRPGSPFNAEESFAKRDKNFRRYASSVERAMSLFDTTLQEWADYISFLGRLLKALQTRPPDTHEIPHSRVVSKRLSQCLHPTLPAGVHQKALEVYANVFSALGNHGLSMELSLFLPGLSPLLSFASLKVRPLLLSLFEDYVITLDINTLKPALKAIIMSLLPGLEETGSEEFERTHILLDRFRKVFTNGESTNHIDAADGRFFWQSFFMASISNVSRRQGALAYLERNLPRLAYGVSDETQNGQVHHEDGSGSLPAIPPSVEAVTSPEPGLLIRCFAAGLQDEQLLIQRGFLELLVTHLPLSSIILRSRVSAHDLELLVKAATSVVLRREMSLNRRLWLWFLGQAASSDDIDQSWPSSPQSDGSASDKQAKDSPGRYFELYGLNALVQGLLKSFESDSRSASIRARPLRVCLSLMDRWEVGGLVMPRVFRPAIESVFRYEGFAPSPGAFTEVLRSASVFFDAIQSGLIWKEIISLLSDTTASPENGGWWLQNQIVQRKLELMWFITTRFNIREEEMLRVHIPNALILLLHNGQSLTSNVDSQNVERTLAILASILMIVAHLIEQLPERAFGEQISRVTQAQLSGDSIDGEESTINIPLKIRNYYHQDASRYRNAAAGLYSASALLDALFAGSKTLIVACLSKPTLRSQLNSALLIATKLLSKTSTPERFGSQTILSTLVQVTNGSKKFQLSTFTDILGQVPTLELVHSTVDPDYWQSSPHVRQVLARLISSLWAHVSPTKLRHNVDAIRCMWRLHQLSPDTHMVEAAVTRFLYRDENGFDSHQPTINGLRCFITLWSQSVTTTVSSVNIRPFGLSKNSMPERRSDKGLPDPESLARPLFLVLDTLRDPQGELSILTSRWLQTIPNLNLIFDLLLERLYASPLVRKIQEGAATPSLQSLDGKIDDQQEEVIYNLETLANILTSGWENASTALTTRSFHSLPGDRDARYQSSHNAPKSSGGEGESQSPIQEHLLHFCGSLLQEMLLHQSNEPFSGRALLQAAVELLKQLIVNLEAGTAAVTYLEALLTKCLCWSVDRADTRLQSSLMDIIRIVLKKRPSSSELHAASQARNTSKEYGRSQALVSSSTEDVVKAVPTESSVRDDSKLLDCLILGFGSPDSHAVLQEWVLFLEYILPYYSLSIFQILLPLVDCICKGIGSLFERIQAIFSRNPNGASTKSEPIQSLNLLFNALESVIAKGHDHIARDEARKFRLPEPSQGYFGNMVTGLFAAEAQASRPATANDRLSVLLCFRDAVRISYKVWAWEYEPDKPSQLDPGIAATFSHISIRLRNRTRRALENLLCAEPLECLEVLADIWASPIAKAAPVMDLLHTLEATRPKNTMPLIFNALYSRTNPTVLDAFRQSTLTTDLNDGQLANFLLAYTQSMDDDALDEIWTDCISFSKDVLANPMPQRQILPLLLEFIAMLGEKIDNTNFGEQRRMRRDISDLFVRLLGAMFTIKPLSFSNDMMLPSPEALADSAKISQELGESREITDVVAILGSILPKMIRLLIDTDRISSAASTISSQILMPTFHWKGFPHNVTPGTLKVMQTMSRVTEASKTWRKDVAEAFNDSRFFSTKSLALVETGWMPVLRQWALTDRERMPEILSRLSAPTSAGIVFGVGASSARLEADRKAQVNLRRAALLILAADEDSFAPNMKLMQEKLIDLLNATASSSPSSATRAEIYMVFRALILRNAPVHLTSLWPIINSELYDALASIGRIASRETYSITSILQAAKLLDTLLLLGPDDFQLREWLYVTDTIDAVYKPPEWKPVALVDELVEVLDNEASAANSAPAHIATDNSEGGLKPLLRWDDIHTVPREKVLDQVLRPFLRHLSINAFESMYEMGTADRKACCEELMKDLFDDSSLV